MNGDKFQQLIDIMKKLRSPEGCPWDIEQTHESLKPYLLEEAFEVLEALDNKNPAELKEELGDLILQSVFHAQIAEENHDFNMNDVLEAINEKLIRRHPHVFGDVEINSSDEQRVHWEKIKKNEGKASVIDGVPKMLPSLLRANRIQQKAATVGFDWEKVEQVWNKVEEEFDELLDAYNDKDEEAIQEEFGDLLFALVNLSRFMKVNPEEALRQAIDKFIKRFKRLENVMTKEGKDMQTATLKEMDIIWDQIKKE